MGNIGFAQDRFDTPVLYAAPCFRHAASEPTLSRGSRTQEPAADTAKFCMMRPMSDAECLLPLAHPPTKCSMGRDILPEEGPTRPTTRREHASPGGRYSRGNVGVGGNMRYDNYRP